jgi:hypothetical protein
VIEERGERGIVAPDVEDEGRLVVQAELGPGDDLEQLLEGAVAARDAMKASASSAMRALRACMSATTCVWVSRVWSSSAVASAAGITPTTSPPAASAASARMPISPQLPAPYTRPTSRSASLVPRAAAAAVCRGS